MGETTDYRETGREVGVLDYWRAVWKRRWLIASMCVFALLVAAGYSLRLPKIFVSSVTALMPRDEVGFGENRISLSSPGGMGIGGGPGGMQGTGGTLIPSLGISLAVPTPNRDAYLAYLNSRTMSEEVVEHFKQSWGPSVGSLIGGMTAEVGKDTILRVTVESQDPRLSAELANFYLEHLEEMLARKSKRIRDLQQKFYLSRLEPARQDLEEAQKALLAFQEKHRTLGLSEGEKAMIAAGAGAATSVVAMEMQRTLKGMYLTDRHPEMVVLDRQIYEAKKVMSHSLYGEPQDLPPEGPKSPPRKEFFVAAAKMTPLQFKAADVLRTLQIRQGVYQMIATHVEMSKYAESSSSPRIDVLDPAIPPRAPSKPNIRYNVMAAGIGSVVLGIFLALFLEYIERVKSQEQLQTMEPRRAGRRLVPAPELATGPLSEPFSGRISLGDSPDREPVVRSPEGRRFL
jgi:capsular polysaccharide biosynthesis protein